MALPGECVSTGAAPPYEGAAPEICQSAAGYYVGYLDEDGQPYSRESDYYADRDELDRLWLVDCVLWRGWRSVLHPEVAGLWGEDEHPNAPDDGPQRLYDIFNKFPGIGFPEKEASDD